MMQPWTMFWVVFLEMCNRGGVNVALLTFVTLNCAKTILISDLPEFHFIRSLLVLDSLVWQVFSFLSWLFCEKVPYISWLCPFGCLVNYCTVIYWQGLENDQAYGKRKSSHISGVWVIRVWLSLSATRKIQRHFNQDLKS